MSNRSETPPSGANAPFPTFSGKPPVWCSDLLCEAARLPQAGGRTFCRNGVQVTLQSVDRTQAALIKRRSGNYATLQPSLQANEDDVARAASDCIRSLLRRSNVRRGTLLVVGLGNDRYVADALGTRTVQKIKPTRGERFALRALVPTVESVTGVSSFDVTAGVAARIAPAAVLAIDTLATSHAERLGNCFQLTDAGIAPGGGVSDAERSWDASAFGVPVIGMGVPLLIDPRSFGGRDDLPLPRAVMPYDADDLIERASNIFAAAISALA